MEEPAEERRVIKVASPTHFHQDVTNKRMKLVNRVKQYGLVFDKRVFDPVTKLTLPYGFMWISEGDEDNVDI